VSTALAAEVSTALVAEVSATLVAEVSGAAGAAVVAVSFAPSVDSPALLQAAKAAAIAKTNNTFFIFLNFNYLNNTY
jgi:hypothetical protein